MTNNNINIKTLENFIKECSLHGFDDYEPYINYDLEPKAQEAAFNTPLLNNSGLKLFEDKNSSALFLADYKGRLIGYCSAFPYLDKSGYLLYEISVLITPDYRRHRLGSLLVSRMLSLIGNEGGLKGNTSDTGSECEVHILLSGSNEGFAEHNGFTYSHSEHFMVRRPYSEQDKETSVMDTAKAQAADGSDISIARTSHRTVGHHTYRLFSHGRSASKCTVLECSDYVNIANVYTNKAFRGCRYAGMLINAVASDFPEKKLLLQVSGSNTAAIHAYTEAGFTFLKTFDYYRLDS